MTRVKICGLTRVEDMEFAVAEGADAVGLVFEPASRRFVKDPAPLLAAATPFVVVVGVFGKTHVHAPFDRLQAVQGAEWEHVPICPHRRIRAVRVKPGDSLSSALEGPEGFEGLLLDAFSETAYGGTGKTVNWDLAAEIVAASRLPVILAGGLTPENVAEAIAKVKPYGVDVSSGVESAPGQKDRSKVRDFIQAARSIKNL
jgi:phosphoribosylanthranilate isomerase